MLSGKYDRKISPFQPTQRRKSTRDRQVEGEREREIVWLHAHPLTLTCELGDNLHESTTDIVINRPHSTFCSVRGSEFVKWEQHCWHIIRMLILWYDDRVSKIIRCILLQFCFT
jgi:hypothetical protein